MKRGFSLIEMVIVLMILGIIAAMAAPRYSSAADGYKLQSSQTQLLAVLDSWKERAGSSSKLHTIYFDTDADIAYLFEGTTQDIKLAVDQFDLGSAPFEVDLQKTNLLDPVGEITINGFGLYEKDFLVRLVKADMMIDVNIQGGGKSDIPIEPGVPTDLLDDLPAPVGVGP